MSYVSMLIYASYTMSGSSVTEGSTVTIETSGYIFNSGDYTLVWCKGTLDDYVELSNTGTTTWSTTISTDKWVTSVLTLSSVTTNSAGTYFLAVVYASDTGDITYGSVATLTVTSSSSNSGDSTDSTDIPDAQSWYSFVCKTYGSVLSTGSVLAEFSRILVFNLNTNTIHPGYGFPITCTLANTSPCAGNAQLPSGLFGCTADGYVVQLFSSNAPGLGTPIRRVAWKIASGSTTTVVPVTLTTDEDFLPLEDIMLGLPVVIEYADGTTAAGTIASNTVSSVTLSSALSVVPSTGDTILIAPMQCGVLFGERRYRYPSNIAGMMLDVENRQGQTQPITLGLFKAAADSNVVDINDGMAVKAITTDRTRLARGGQIMLPRIASTALAPVLEFQPRAAGTLQISGLALLEDARNGGTK